MNWSTANRPGKRLPGSLGRAAVSARADVWVIDLDRSMSGAARADAVLTPEERARAGRFRRRDDALRWSLSRAALRLTLADRLGVAPQAVVLEHGSHGKPRVRVGTGMPPLFFNVSHSGGLAVLCLSADAPVGVDVEAVRSIDGLDAIVGRVGSASERSALRTLAGAARMRAFFALWTRKEAVVKALGKGLHLPLERFSVALLPGEPVRVLASELDELPPQSCCLRDLQLADGYAGALAMIGASDLSVRVRGFDPGRILELPAS